MKPEAPKFPRALPGASEPQRLQVLELERAARVFVRKWARPEAHPRGELTDDFERIVEARRSLPAELERALNPVFWSAVASARAAAIQVLKPVTAPAGDLRRSMAQVRAGLRSDAVSAFRYTETSHDFISQAMALWQRRDPTLDIATLSAQLQNAHAAGSSLLAESPSLHSAIRAFGLTRGQVLRVALGATMFSLVEAHIAELLDGAAFGRGLAPVTEPQRFLQVSNGARLAVPAAYQGVVWLQTLRQLERPGVPVYAGNQTLGSQVHTALGVLESINEEPREGAVRGIILAAAPANLTSSFDPDTRILWVVGDLEKRSGIVVDLELVQLLGKGVCHSTQASRLPGWLAELDAFQHVERLQMRIARTDPVAFEMLQETLSGVDAEPHTRVAGMLDAVHSLEPGRAFLADANIDILKSVNVERAESLDATARR